jgi:DNA-binding transcriptional ArsR family regulator
LSRDSSVPDYDLDEVRTISSPPEIRAAFHALRGTVLDLLLERAATVAELAEATGRPNSTIAYHVDVLLDAGLVTVVRTRKVRAIDQRYYGRTARVFVVGAIEPEQIPHVTNYLSTAAAESAPAHAARPPPRVHPPRPDLRAASRRVLAAGVRSRQTVLPTPPTRRPELRARRRPLPDRPPDAARPGGFRFVNFPPARSILVMCTRSRAATPSWRSSPAEATSRHWPG